MATPAPPRTMPRLLKATYLADQEFLMEETRGTRLYYFPGPVFFLLVFGALLVVTYFRIPPLGSAIASVNSFPLRHYLDYLFGFLVIVGLVWLFIRYLRWISTVYAVTSRRVILQRGIVSKSFDEIPVIQVRGVDVHQSAAQRLLGYGTVRVSSEGGKTLGNEDWKGIPKPFKFQKVIENATIGATTPAYAAPPPGWGAAAPATGAPPPWPPPPGH